MKVMMALGAGLALALAPPAGAQSVKAGVEQWRQGKSAEAVRIWLPLAEKGDPDAANNVGQAYRQGKGVPLDLGKAQKWFEIAARKGHVHAATSLGVLMFENGNQVGAMRWLKQAADAGEERALLLYGVALYNGDGVKADPVLAYAYVSRAAATGLGPAKATLADMDAMMPLEQRQRGIAIALDAAKGKGAPASSAKSSPPPVKVAAKPTPVAATAATAAPAASGGGWRIQLGAFSKRSSAEALFRSLGGALGGRQAYYVAAGAVTRLQVGPFATRADASATCARLRQACFAVPAR